jgi:hypothetical protein
MVLVVNDDRVGRLILWLYQMLDDPDPSRHANLFQLVPGLKSYPLNWPAHPVAPCWAKLVGSFLGESVA